MPNHLKQNPVTMNIDNSHDIEFKSLENLNWLPWVGSNYNQMKILLFAESHYDDKEYWLINKDATRHFVNNQGFNSQNPNFKNRKLFQQIERTLLNTDTSSFAQREKLWKNVAFYNLVQRLLPDISERPTLDDYDKGWLNFFDIVNILKPRVCIKFGYEGIGRLGYYLNNFDNGWKRDNIQDFYQRPFCVNLTKEEYKLRIIFTWHPTGSRGFNYMQWSDHIKNKFPEVNSLFD